MVLLFLAWSGIAFALQDTTGTSKSERAKPADNVDYESGDEEYTSDEDYDRSHARAVPEGEVSDWKRTERNKEYYQEDVKKHDFDKKKWEDVTKGINYLDDAPKKEKKKEEEEKKPEDTSSKDWNFDMSGGATVLKVILFTVIILALAFIIYKLLGGTFVRNRKIGENKVFTIEDIEERLHESDLDRLLREALSKGDFRLAVRIYYLAIIKELSVKEWIRWKKDKTNREYLNEMIARKPDLYNGFRETTLAFERVWYGDLEIKESEYNMLSPRFRNFIDSINRAQ